MRIPQTAGFLGREKAFPARPAIAVGLGSLALVAATFGLKGVVNGAGGAASLAAIQVIVLLCAAAWLLARPIETVAADLPGVVPTAAMADAVTWHDRYGDVIRASAACQGVLGAGPASLRGGGLLARVQVADRPAFLRALDEAANGAEPVVTAFRVIKVSDEVEAGAPEVAWVEMRAQRAPVTDRDRAAVVAFTRDVTTRIRHAEEIEAARAEAERANEMKGRFLATVTHELRTPLNAIIGFSELLSADHPFLITDERRKEYAEIIRNSGHHLLEIVNTLLDMSKIESGNFSFDPERFALAGLLAGTCDIMQVRADQAGVTLRRDVAANLPEIVADRRACRQILLNLVSNAVKFTPAGGTVTVSLQCRDGELAVTVADTGIGIPEGDLPRLGDPFFQSGPVHARKHEGTGLGLSVVRGLVGLHGGRLAIESGTGAGTTVTVLLPLHPESREGRGGPVVVQVRPRVAAPTLERMSA